MNNNDNLFPIINNKRLQREDYIEWMTMVMDNRIKVPFIVVVSLSIVFYVLVLILLLLGMKTVSAFYIVLVSVCLIIALFFRLIIPGALGQLRYSQACLTNKDSRRTVIFYEDHLELKAEDEILTSLCYAIIKKTMVSNHLFIIVFPKMVNCVVRLDGFSEIDLKIIQTQILSAMENRGKSR